MNSRLALQIISAGPGGEKNGVYRYLPGIKSLYAMAFPGKDFPRVTNTMLGVELTDSDEDRARRELFEAALDYLAAKLE